MKACTWEYCMDTRKHYYTEKLGSPETFLIFMLGNKTFNVNDAEFDESILSMGCILVNL